MAALPYIQLYVADYFADTWHLTTEEHGAYLLLIFNYWQTGKPIPKSRLASVARMPSDRWESVENTLSEFFTEDENGGWYHERIEQDLAKVKSKSIQASNAGKQSAAKRASSKATENKGKIDGRSTDAKNPLQRKGNHTDTEADTKKDSKNQYGDEFLKDWDDYPKRAGGNPKGPAANQRKARINEGYTSNEINSGIKRYFLFCQATGKIGTEYVMQTKRFLGRDKHFLEPWLLPLQTIKPSEPGKIERAAKALDDARNNNTAADGGAGNAGHVSQTTPQLPKS